MHILVNILLIPTLVVCLASVSVISKLYISLAFIVLAGCFANQTYANMVSKLKVILFTLFVLYALTTPGQLLLDNDAYYNLITKEGLLLASLQTLHLLAVLALITLILHNSTRSELMGGFYQILNLLPCARGFAMRFVARLWLVLYAIEHQLHQHFGLMETLQLLTAEDDMFSKDLVHVTIKVYKLTWVDKLFVLALLMIILSLAYSHS